MPRLRQRRLGDIHVTALAAKRFPLFRNDGHGAFRRGNAIERLASDGEVVGLCSIVADIDNDGWKDNLHGNSHVNDRIGDFQAVAFSQSNTLFINDGRAIPRRHTRGSLATAVAVHRDAHRDFNGDGRSIWPSSRSAPPAELWQNESASRTSG